MCDKDHYDEDLKSYREKSIVTRRTFGAMSLGAGAMALLPSVVNAAAVTGSDVKVKTPDGTADCYFVHPSTGATAAVIMWPDILGLRPAFRDMGKRLAESGYAVLVVNPFYRAKPAPVVPAGAKFSDPKIREIVSPMAQALTTTATMTDAKAFVAFLDAQAAVDKKRKIGTAGYCMSGPMTIETAAAVPDRIGAGASFHGGSLVTKEPDSPHLLVPKIKAQYLFAIAENDDQRDPDAKNVLRDTFAKANLPAEIEVYPAPHGWCAPDGDNYNAEQAAKAWGRMLALFGKALV
jgi:carboxymethylenebutenolidase